MRSLSSSGSALISSRATRRRWTSGSRARSSQRSLREIDCIHHMAQVSYLGADRQLATQVNVGGAREVLEVAAQCTSLKCLVFHSTAQVSGDRTGLVLEGELDKGQAFRNAVEETLARGERIVRVEDGQAADLRSSARRSSSATRRPARSTASTVRTSSSCSSSRRPPEFPLPLPGRGDALLHLVPIDYVVRAAQRDRSSIRARPGAPSTSEIRRRSRRGACSSSSPIAGGRRSPRGFIPANLTKALLRTPGLDRFAKSPRAFLDALATPVSYSFANTAELLADSDVRCPPFESYVERLVEYVQHRLREKRARDRESAEVDDPLV